MYKTPLLPPPRSETNHGLLLPSIVFLLMAAAMLFHDTYNKQLSHEPQFAPAKQTPVGVVDSSAILEEVPNGALFNFGPFKKTPKDSCKNFESVAKKKCHESWIGYAITGVRRGALATNRQCAGQPCKDSDFGSCCVKALRCTHYTETSEAICPDGTEENVDEKAFCKTFPCSKAADEKTCCVPVGSNYIVESNQVRVYTDMKEEASLVIKTYKPGRKINIVATTKKGGKEWGKVNAESRTAWWTKVGYVVISDGSEKPNFRKVNMEQIQLPDCSATGEYEKFAAAKKGETFEITCPATCDAQIQGYTWKAKDTLNARVSPESDQKIPGTGWKWDKGVAIKISKVREHTDYLWGAYQRKKGADTYEGWFRLRKTTPPFTVYASFEASNVVGCASTYWGFADYAKRTSPICIAARTRWQFKGDMEITFSTEPDSYKSCDKGGVVTSGGKPGNPKGLAYRIGLAGQEKFKKSSSKLGELMTRKLSRFKQPGKIILKLVLKAALGIALAIAVSAAAGAVTAAIVASGGIAATPIIVGLAFAIPQGLAAHGIGLAIDTTVDRWWESTKIKEDPKRVSWWTAFKTACKKQGWQGWLAGGVKGMLWPMLGQIPLVNEVATAAYGGLLKIEPGEYAGPVAEWVTNTFGDGKGAIQMSIAFTGWIMNTMFWMFNTANERGVSRIDIFAQTVGMMHAKTQRSETAIGSEFAVGVTDQNADELLAGCELDMNDRSKNCILKQIRFDDGVPVIPIALMGKIATNLGADWRLCEKSVEDSNGVVSKQLYYCLAGDDYQKSEIYLDGVSDQGVTTTFVPSSDSNTDK